jgi:hypothetical protein
VNVRRLVLTLPLVPAALCIAIGGLVAARQESCDHQSAEAPQSEARVSVVETSPKSRRRRIEPLRRAAAAHTHEVNASSQADAIPDGVGQILFTDLTPDLHVTIDGETERTRRHDLSPGSHSVVLFERGREIARRTVAVPLGGITLVAIADFEVDASCMARSQHETLLPERRLKSCCYGSTYGDFAMVWLTRHQSADGRWSASGFEEACEGKRCGGARQDVGDAEATALALLTYLGAGETHNSGAFKESVKAGLRGLKALQNDEGWFVAAHDRRAQAICALAMMEAYWTTGSRLWKPSAERALALLVGSQPSTDPETAALEACVLASARAAEALPREGDAIIAGARRNLASFGLPGPSMPRVTALLLGARTLLVEKASESADLVAGAQALTEHLAWVGDSGLGHTIDPMTTYFTTIAAFRVGGPTWKSWNSRLEALVIDTQVHGGSWDPAGDAATHEKRSRLTTTVLQMLTLEIYYRYGRVFGASER